MDKIKVDATNPVAVTAQGFDKEDNPVAISTDSLALTLESTNDGNVGEIDGNVWNPGEAGAEGVLKGSVSYGEEKFTAEMPFVLEAGGLDHIALKMTPEGTPAPADAPTGETTPPEDAPPSGGVGTNSEEPQTPPES